MASKLQDLINRLCPNGVEYRKLGEVCSYATERIDSSSVSSHTYVGVESLLQDRCGRVDSFSVPSEGRVIAFKPGDVLVGNIRPYLKKIWLSDIDGGTNGDVLVFQIHDRGKLLPRFLYQVLASDSFFAFDMQYAKGSKMPRGDKEAVLKYEIPVPPLEVQSEIVQILDNFAELTAELTAELEKRKKQYEHYRRALLCGVESSELRVESSGWPMVKLGDVCKFVYGFTDKAKDSGNARFIRITDITEDGHLDPNGAKYITLSCDAKKYLVSTGDLLMARTGATYGKPLYVDSDAPAVYASFLIKIVPDNKRLMNRYYWHFSQSGLYWEQANRLVTVGGQPQFNTGAISQVTIPLPPLAEQRRIVSILDRFDRLCNDLTSGLPAEIAARKKQYAYYRDKLLELRVGS